MKKKRKIRKRKMKSKISKKSIIDIKRHEGEGELWSAFLETKFGKLKVECLGKIEAPNLILLFHGDGRSYSEGMAEFYPEIFTLMKSKEIGDNFLVVAVDRPGRGKSEGTRQSERDEIGVIMKAIIVSFGFRKATIMAGISQGAVIIIKALLENTRLSNKMILMLPLWPTSRMTQISKLSKIRTVIICDKSDNHHPVSHGKLINKRLDNCDLHIYNGRDQSDWIEENFGRILVEEMMKK